MLLNRTCYYLVLNDAVLSPLHATCSTRILQDVPWNIRRAIWFKHNEVPPHFQLYVREYLNQNFPNRWIGKGSYLRDLLSLQPLISFMELTFFLGLYFIIYL